MTLLFDLLAVMRRPRLIVITFVLRSVVAIGLARSCSTLLAPEWVMAQRGGVRELWAPGAAILLRVMAERAQSLARLARTDALIGLALIVVGGVASAIVLCGLAEDPRARFSIWLRRGLRRSPRIVAIAVSGWLFSAVVLMVAKLAAPVIPTSVYPVAGELGADCALGLLILATLFAVFLAIVASDLARALVAREDLGFFAAMACALQCLIEARARCIVGAGAFILPAIFVAPLLELCLPSASSSGLLGLAIRVLAHQVAILSLCALHLGWWTRALNLVQVPAIQSEADA